MFSCRPDQRSILTLIRHIQISLKFSLSPEMSPLKVHISLMKQNYYGKRKKVVHLWPTFRLLLWWAMCMCDSRCPMSIICCDGQTDILQAEIERKARRWLAAAKASSAAWTRFRFLSGPADRAPQVERHVGWYAIRWSNSCLGAFYSELVQSLGDPGIFFELADHSLQTNIHGMSENREPKTPNIRASWER